MFVIYNNAGLIVGVILLCVALLLKAILPDFAFKTSLILLLCSYVALWLERTDVKGRLFFLPLWVYLIPLSFYFAFQEGSFYGLLFASIPIPIIYFLAGFLSKKFEEMRLESSAHAFVLFQKTPASKKVFWRSAQNALFLPKHQVFTKLICKRNLVVCKRLQDLGVDFTELNHLTKKMEDSILSENFANIQVGELVRKRVFEYLEAMEAKTA